MKKTELKRVSEKLKSTKELPEWLVQGIPVNKQIRLIRQALGMTQEQLASLLKTKQNAIARMETKAGNLELSTLQKIAESLNCEVLTLLVPRQKILELLEEKSLEEAKRLVSLSTGSTAIEEQLPDSEAIQEQIRETQNEILQKYRSSLWQKKKQEKKR